MSMFESYEELSLEVTDLLARGDLEAKVPLWLQLTESDMQKKLRDFRETLLETTGATFVAGQDFVTLPTGFREALFLRIDTSQERRLSIVSADKLIDVRVNGRNAGIDHPIAAAYGGELKLLIAPAPTSADPYTLFYHGRLANIDQSKTTSQVLRDTPEALLYGAAYHGANFVRNWELADRFNQIYTDARTTYGAFLFRARTSGGDIRVRPDQIPNDAYSRELTSPN